ncbi:hypothetical protein [Extensimonas sp. H3M7-6]|jgi:hypothetical protein|uniref:hypothetical protein n=1 Tax=Betaproteobacteria TaxID=28216 RepID=UPI0023D9B5EC|nr:hypothetical protein [Extensimonas sp. H3M7-6]MDF1483463.1 hypothetical protein [Extensimonas sp. H3M7-6]
MFWQALSAMRDLRRLHEIASILVRYGFGDMVRRMGLSNALERAGTALHWSEAADFAHMTPPERVRRALEEMGPTLSSSVRCALPGPIYSNPSGPPKQLQLSEMLSDLVVIPRQHHLVLPNDQLDHAANRLVIGIVVAALIVGSSIVMTVPGGPTLLGLPVFGLLGFLGATVGGLWILFSILHSGRGR